jgi:ATP-dependent Clp protease ATP-binding subunit ClpA
MDYHQLITIQAQESNQTRPQYAAALALKVLENSPSLLSLFSTNSVAEKLVAIQNEQAQSKPRFSFGPSHTDFVADFLHQCAIQRKVLSCPDNDEHVVFLASLKVLEQEKKAFTYSQVLKELLRKNLHKLHDFTGDVEFIGRTKEIENVLRVLNLTERNNALIIGPAGVGKTALAKTVMRMAENKDTFQLFPGSDTLEDQVLNILSSSDKKNLFLLDEIFSFSTAQINFLIDKAQVIATSSETSYRKFAAEQSGIISKFDVSILSEPNPDELRAILSVHQERIINQNHVQYSDQTLEEIIKLTKQHINELSFPAKGISLMEETAQFARSQNETEVTPEMVRVVVSQKANIPIASLTDFDKKDLSQLDERIQQRVKGQDHAVKKIARSIQRSRLGLNRKNKPIGSFLLVGPSGVGKTELAKVLAQEIFGDEDNMIRIDMSEYSEPHTVQRLIGAPPGYVGYEEGGQLTNPVKNKPYSLVLLDEIEKAHPKVFDVFLQILDDGRLTDGRGKLVDFRNTMIIATSNAGIEDILDLIEEGKLHAEIEKEIKEIMQDYFRIEFLNRFDDIVVFKALDVPSLIGIADLQVKKLAIELYARGITLEVKPETLQQLAESAYDPKYGARGLQRIIQENLEDPIVEMLMRDQVKPGERIVY